jgi:hypothetical protein
MRKSIRTPILLALWTFTVLSAFAITARAATLDDYQRRVSTAAKLIEEVRGAGEDESYSEPEQFITSNLALVRELLPARETVNLSKQNIEINNSWLHDALAESEKATSGAKRADMLGRIAERLHALDERLKEIQKANATQTSDKEADKGRLAEILRRPEYIQTAPEGSALERLLQRFLRWLANLIPTPKPLQPGGSPLLSAIAQIVVVGICIAAIALAIWKFAPRFLESRRKKKKKEREARVILGERLEPDQTAADLLAQAEALAREGDLRAAIRKAYIALLCELGDRKLISLADHKTNRDYLHSVRDKASLYAAMRKVTLTFETHWYGLVPAAEPDWTAFRNDYHRIVRTPSP